MIFDPLSINALFDSFEVEKGVFIGLKQVMSCINPIKMPCISSKILHNIERTTTFASVFKQFIMSITRRLIAFLLAVAMLSQTLSVVGTLVSFRTNRAYYEALCVNKNRPELACQGKCVLMQRLENQLDTEQQKQTHQLKNLIERDITWIFEIKHPLSIKPILGRFLSPKTANFHYSSTLSRLCEDAVFHPPLVVV